MIKWHAAALATVCTLLLGVPSVANAQSATLAWDANTETDLAGYKLAYGNASKTYTKEIDVGKQTTYTVSGLDTTKNTYFAVRAYSTSGLHSGYSAEVMLAATTAPPPPPPPPPPPVTTISSFTASATPPYLAGQSVTWTTIASNTAGPVEYKVFLYGTQTGWVVARNWSSTNTFTWTPTGADVGDHAVQVWVRAVGSTAQYEAWIGTPMFKVSAQPLVLSADVDFPTPPGNPVKWTATLSSATDPMEFKFVQLNQATGVWSVVRDYASSNEFIWTPAQTGNYTIEAWARKVGSTVQNEATASSGVITVSQTALQLSVKANVTFPALTSTGITWTVRPKGGTAGPLQFRFWRYSAKTAQWTMVQDYSTSKTYTWVPGWGEEGQYNLQVHARNAGSTAASDAAVNTGVFQIDRAPMQLSADKLFPVAPGTTVTIRADAGSPAVAYEYHFWLYSQATGTWTSVRPYNTSNTYAWTANAVGIYAFQVWARKVGSTETWESWRSTDYLEVSQSPAQMKQLTVSTPLPATVGTAITWTAYASGGTAGPVQYAFYLYREGLGWSLLRGYSSSNSVSWTPTAAGTYAVQAWVRSAGSTATYESWMGTGYFQIKP